MLLGWGHLRPHRVWHEATICATTSRPGPTSAHMGHGKGPCQQVAMSMGNARGTG